MANILGLEHQSLWQKLNSFIFDLEKTLEYDFIQ